MSVWNNAHVCVCSSSSRRRRRRSITWAIGNLVCVYKLRISINAIAKYNIPYLYMFIREKWYEEHHGSAYRCVSYVDGLLAQYVLRACACGCVLALTAVVISWDAEYRHMHRAFFLSFVCGTEWCSSECMLSQWVRSSCLFHIQTELHKYSHTQRRSRAVCERECSRPQWMLVRGALGSAVRAD